MEYVKITGVIGGLLTSCSGFPQIYKMIKTKQTKDISWVMVSMSNIGLTLTLIYGIKIDEFPVYLNCIISLISTMTIIILKIYYEIMNRKYELLDG